MQCKSSGFIPISGNSHLGDGGPDLFFPGTTPMLWVAHSARLSRLRNRRWLQDCKRAVNRLSAPSFAPVHGLGIFSSSRREAEKKTTPPPFNTRTPRREHAECGTHSIGVVRGKKNQDRPPIPW
jgi:hypothetical protein